MSSPLTTKHLSGDEFAATLAESLARDDHVNLALACLRAAQHVQTLELRGADKKVIAMAILRKVCSATDQTFHEAAFSDLLDLVIALSENPAILTLVQRLKACLGCGGTAAAAEARSAAPRAPPKYTSERDVLEHVTTVVNLAILARDLVEYFDTVEAMTGVEKKERALALVRQVLAQAGQAELVDDAFVQDVLQLIFDLIHGVLALSQRV